MANYCFTTYWVEGKETGLRKLASAIGEGKDVTQIFKKLGIPIDETDFKNEGHPFWHDASIKDGVLTFKEEARWEQSRCMSRVWNYMRSEIRDVVFYSMVAESGLHETNDRAGKYFPHRLAVFVDKQAKGPAPYIYSLSDESMLYFRDERQMLDYFRKDRGWSADDALNLRILAGTSGYFMDIHDVEVVDRPTHAGVNELSFSYCDDEDGTDGVTVSESKKKKYPEPEPGKKKIVYVDLVGVLSDYGSGFDNMCDLLSVPKSLLHDPDEVPGIYALMDPMPGAIYAIERLMKYYDIYILTSAPWGNPTAWGEMLKWVQKYLGPTFKDRFIISNHKNLLKGDYLIDDRINMGALLFTGKRIDFGSALYPHWGEVERYLMDELL